MLMRIMRSKFTKISPYQISNRGARARRAGHGSALDDCPYDVTRFQGGPEERGGGRIQVVKMLTYK